MKSNKFSFFFILFIAFVDYMGVGLIYPLFSSMLFNPELGFLSAQATPATRGLWLGVTLAMMPLIQFFSSPYWGYFSDRIGRKKPLLITLLVGIVAYAIALAGVVGENLVLLILSRFLLGISTGNMAVVQAVVTDLSSKQDKARNFGLYNMALGVGFTLGPFLGGLFSHCGFLHCKEFTLPFWFALSLTILNFLCVLVGFKETHRLFLKKAFSLMTGIQNLKRAFYDDAVRALFITTFVFTFGWSFFFEFMPVFLIGNFRFTPRLLGIFYAISGCVYALCCGLLIRPIVNRFKPQTVLFFGLVSSGLFVGSYVFTSFLPIILWLLLLPVCYSVSLVFPTLTTTLSDNSPDEQQGEVMGIYQSVSSAALALSPLFSGYIVGWNNYMPVVIGALAMWAAAAILASSFRSRTLNLSQ